jgi:hypothetical protein
MNKPETPNSANDPEKRSTRSGDEGDWVLIVVSGFSFDYGTA